MSSRLQEPMHRAACRRLKLAPHSHRPAFQHTRTFCARRSAARRLMNDGTGLPTESGPRRRSSMRHVGVEIGLVTIDQVGVTGISVTVAADSPFRRATRARDVRRLDPGVELRPCARRNSSIIVCLQSLRGSLPPPSAKIGLGTYVEGFTYRPTTCASYWLAILPAISRLQRLRGLSSTGTSTRLEHTFTLSLCVTAKAA